MAEPTSLNDHRYIRRLSLFASGAMAIVVITFLSILAVRQPGLVDRDAMARLAAGRHDPDTTASVGPRSSPRHGAASRKEALDRGGLADLAAGEQPLPPRPAGRVR